MLAASHMFGVHLGWADLATAAPVAERAAASAVQLDHEDAWAHAALGSVYFSTRRLDHSLAEFEMALRMNPNFCLAQGYYALALSYAGRTEDSFEAAQRAIRHSPRDPSLAIYYGIAGYAQFVTRQYDEAIALAREATRHRGDLTGAYRVLAVSRRHDRRPADRRDGASGVSPDPAQYFPVLDRDPVALEERRRPGALSGGLSPRRADVNRPLPAGVPHWPAAGLACYAGRMIDALSIAQALLRCPSVTPADAGALGVLEDLLKANGFETHRVTFGEPGTADIDNLYARIGDTAPHITFAGHTDVVPAGDEAAWSHGAFSGDVKDGILYGRGAVDMKGGIACSVAAVLQYLADNGGKPKGSISFLITGDEEDISVNGTIKLLQWVAARGEKFDHCVLGEPSNVEVLGDCIKVGRRGSLHGMLIVDGIQGHVAYPHRASNSGAGYFKIDRGAERRAARSR